MTDATTERHLPLQGTYNVRDVGGYATVDGGRTRWGTLLRSDALHRLDVDGRERLRTLGVRTIVDLRDEWERTNFPDALGHLDARVAWTPLFPDIRRPTATMRGDWTLLDVYMDAVERIGDRLAAAIAELCRPGSLPALVHCTAGKDRTGLVTALALSAVGVPDRDVCEDFALSARYLRGSFLDEARARAVASGAGEDRLWIQYAAEPEWMASALQHVCDRHGDARGYLRDHGLSDQELDALRDALVEPAQATKST
jgi:protein-tyrosine phosphatase